MHRGLYTRAPLVIQVIQVTQVTHQKKMTTRTTCFDAVRDMPPDLLCARTVFEHDTYSGDTRFDQIRIWGTANQPLFSVVNSMRVFNVSAWYSTPQSALC